MLLLVLLLLPGTFAHSAPEGASAPVHCTLWLKTEGARPPGYSGQVIGLLAPLIEKDQERVILSLNDHQGWIENFDFDPTRSVSAQNPLYLYDHQFLFFPKWGDYLVVFRPDGSLLYKGVLNRSRAQALDNVQMGNLRWLVGADTELYPTLFNEGLEAILFTR